MEFLKRNAFFRHAIELARDHRVKRAFNTASSIVESAQHFFEKPSAWTALRDSVGVLNAFIDDQEVYADEFFERRTDEWTEAYSHFLSGIILNTMSLDESAAADVIKTYDPSTTIKIHRHAGFSVGYTFNVKLKRVDSPIYASGDVEAMRAFITSMLWRTIGSSNVSLIMLDTHRDKKYAFAADSIDDIIDDNPRCDEIVSYLRRCAEVNLNRSIMLYGPPGTAKTTIARAIVARLGYRSLRVRVEDLQYIDNVTMMQLCDLIMPDACVIDDFDRSAAQVMFLEMLERFSKNIKLLIATVNNRNALDEALLRPGRFDEMMLIDRVPECVVRRILGESCQDAFELVRDWPIAFIVELVKRRRVYTREQAESSIRELINRIARLNRDMRKMKNVDDDVASFIEKNSTVVEDSDRYSPSDCSPGD